MIESSLQEKMEIILIEQSQPVGKKSADLAVLFGVGDQVGQVLAQGRFAARKRDVWDACLPGFIQDDAPFVAGELAVDAFGGCIFRIRVSAQSVGKGAVEAQGEVRSAE